MAYVYNKVNWEDTPSTNTPRNATNLGNMDTGIKENNNMLNGTKPMGSIVVDDVSCKNMWIPTLYADGSQIVQTRCSVTLNGDTYSFVASGTDIFIGNVWTTTGNDYNGTLGTLYKVKPNTDYTLSCSNSAFSKNFITFYGSNKKSLSYQELTSNVATFTTPSNCEYITIRIGNGSATSGTTYTTTIQLEVGSATTYTPYKNFDNTEYVLYSKDNLTYYETSYTLSDNPMNYEKIKLYYARYGFASSIEVYPKTMSSVCCTLAYYGNNIPRLYGITFVLNQNSITISNAYYVNFTGNNQYQSQTYGEGQTNNISLYKVVGINKINNLPLTSSSLLSIQSEEE